MARTRIHYRCTACGTDHAGWYGQCPRCQTWNSLEQLEDDGKRAPVRHEAGLHEPISIDHIETATGGEIRVRVGIGELDRVLGGGMVAGSLTLLGGDPGVGKSTLLLEALARLAARGAPALYVSGEESARQIRLRADRLGVGGEQLYVLAETDLSVVRAAVLKLKPRFLVLDSVQVLRAPTTDSLPGGINQVRAVAEQALELAKGHDIATVLVGHVTREGTLAGPRSLEHLVDTVIYFECDGRSPLRILRAVKNRFGSTGELGMFEMGENGLIEVPDASARMLAERRLDAPGTAVVAGLEGSRPLLTEVQALVGRASAGLPARSTQGVDRTRVTLLLAVLEKAGLTMTDRDVYVNAAGGVRLQEPAADLGILAALASSLLERSIDPRLALFGEVGLTGEVRAVSYPRLRLNEAVRHGFTRLILPRSAADDLPAGLEALPVDSVRDLLALI